jgi:Tfp pilus assembly protein PilV
MSNPIILADDDGLRCLESRVLRPPAENGFSLVEVLLAAGLISFLLAGTAELMIKSIEVTRHSDRLVRLTGRLASEIEELKALPFDAEDLAAGRNELRLRTDPDGKPVRVEWTVEAVSENLKRVNFKLSREERPDRVLEAVLLITRELARQ